MSPIGKGEKITAADINALIDDVKTESTRRGDGWGGEPGDVNSGDLLSSVPSDAMYDQLVVLNAIHCSCEADGTTETHNGGVPISLTSNAVGPLSKNVDREIDDDVVSLAAQCSCDSFACSCVAFCNCQTNCNCDSGNCSCQHLCSCDVNCTCDTDCTCDDVCSCNTNCTCNSDWFDMCGDEWWTCLCDANCPCNTYWVCTCELNTTYLCTCEDDCACDTFCICDNDCTCNTDCTCDKECDCEFGG